MSIKVAAWNVAKGLGNGNEARIYEGIKQLDAEIVVLSEAYATDASNPNEHVIDKISDFAMDNGYEFVVETGYNDEGSVNEELQREQYLVVLGRHALKGAGLIRLDNRSAIGLTLLDNQTDVEIQAVAAHFRDENEQLRQDMAQSLTALVDTTKPTLLIGDLNAMHRNSNHARLVRSPIIRGLSKLTNLHPRAKSLSGRLIEMADGGHYGLFEGSWF